MNQLKNENWTRIYRGKAISAHISQISRLQKSKERNAFKLLQSAINVNLMLETLKIKGNQLIEDVYTKIILEPKGEVHQFFEFSCFDGSVTIKRNMNTKYIFDKDKKDHVNHIISKILPEAFSDRDDVSLKSKLNRNLELFIDLKDEQGTTVIKNLLILLSEDPINTDSGQLLELITECIKSSEEDPYFRVYQRNSEGKQELIELSISKI